MSAFPPCPCPSFFGRSHVQLCGQGWEGIFHLALAGTLNYHLMSLLQHNLRKHWALPGESGWLADRKRNQKSMLETNCEPNATCIHILQFLPLLLTQ